MNKKYRRLMIALSVVVGALFAAGFAGVFYPPLLFDMQLLPLIQRLSADFSFAALGLLFLLLLFTFLFGRFYCAALCPMEAIDLLDCSKIPGTCIKCQRCVHICKHHAKSFQDPSFLSHVAMLEKKYTRPAKNVYIW